MNISDGFNVPKDAWKSALRRSFALGRYSKIGLCKTTNRALNSQSASTATTFEQLITASVQKKEQSSNGVHNLVDKTSENQTFLIRKRIKTLETTKTLKFQRYSLAGLEKINQYFTKLDDKKPPVFYLKNSKIFLIYEKLEEAKKLFQNDDKKAKKSFKKLLSLKLLEEEKTIIELYLATIYLLQDKIYKAEPYLKRKAAPFIRGNIASLTQIMSSHVKYLIKKEQEPQTIKEPFLAFWLYGKAEGFSEDEKIMAKKLSQKFNVKKVNP